MTDRRELDAALDAARSGGTARTRSADVEVEVVEADRLGVRLRRLRVERSEPHDVESIGARWPRAVRELPDQVQPVEIAPGLGGATFRSDPDDRTDDTFVEIEVRGAAAEVRRLRPTPSGRQGEDWTMTRDQLHRLIDTLRDEPPSAVMSREQGSSSD